MKFRRCTQGTRIAWKKPGSSDSILPGLCLFPHGNTAAKALERLEKFIHLEDADLFYNYTA